MKFFITLLFFYSSFITFSQIAPFIQRVQLNGEESYHFQYSEEGTIFDIHQDKLGILWIGTTTGLIQFSEYGSIVLSKDSTNLSNEYIRAIFEDSDGTIWIGTDAGGFNRFYREINEFKAFTKDNCGLTENRVWTFAEYQDSLLLVGGQEGLIVFNKEKEVISKVLLKGKGEVQEIYQDTKGLIWVGTSNSGVYVSKKDTLGGFSKVELMEDNSKDSNFDIMSITQDANETIWIGTYSNGVFRRDKDGSYSWYRHLPGDPNSLSNNRVFQIISDTKGKVWISTYWGLNIYQESTDSFLKLYSDPCNVNSISYNKVTCLFEDSSENIWIGTLGKGLNKANKRLAGNFQIFAEPNCLEESVSNSYIRSIFKDSENSIWVGTDYGLNRINTNGSIDKFFEGYGINELPSNDIRSVYESSSKTIWIGTPRGLSSYDPQTKKIRTFRKGSSGLSNSFIRVIFEDSRKNLWIGTHGGLNRFRNNRFVSYAPDKDCYGCISSKEIRAIHEDKEGNLWIGTWKGLNRFNRNTEKFRNYQYSKNDSSTISDNKIISIYEEDGYLWLGTYGNGLNKFDTKSGKAVRYESNITANHVYGIAGYKNELWLSTEKGLLVFDKNEEIVIKSFFTEDGLPSNEFIQSSYFIESNGHSFFGTSNGAIKFKPSEIVTNSVAPRIIAKSAKSFYKGISTKLSLYDTLRIPRKHDYFQIEVEALDYTNQIKNRYKYQLADSIYDIGYSNQIEVRNLNSGFHSIKFYGSNGDGVWSNPLSIMIEIQQPAFGKILQALSDFHSRNSTKWYYWPISSIFAFIWIYSISLLVVLFFATKKGSTFFSRNWVIATISKPFIAIPGLARKALFIGYRQRLLSELNLKTKGVYFGVPAQSPKGPILPDNDGRALHKFIHNYFEDNRYLFVWGSGGAGKSTLLARFCLEVGKRKSSKLDDYIPIFFEPQYYHENLIDSLSNSLVQKYAIAIDSKLLKGQLETGRFLLIIDGLSEFHFTNQNEANSILSFITSAEYPKLRVLISSRPRKSWGIDSSNELKLHEFGIETASLLASAQNKLPLPRIQHLLFQLKSSSISPMLLSLIMETSTFTIESKTTKLTIYELYFRKVLKCDSEEKEFVWKGYSKVLEYIASIFFINSGIRGFGEVHEKLIAALANENIEYFNEIPILSFIEKFYGLEFKSEILLLEYLKGAGLIEFSNRWKFVHDTYDEYFAAMFLINDHFSGEDSSYAKKWLKEFSLQENYSGVADFVNDFIESDKIE